MSTKAFKNQEVQVQSMARKAINCHPSSEVRGRQFQLLSTCAYAAEKVVLKMQRRANAADPLAQAQLYCMR